MMLSLVVSILLGLCHSARAQDHHPGQVRMQIPLGGAPAPSGQPGRLPQPGRQQSGAGPVPSGQNPFSTGQGVPAAPVSQVFSSDAGVESLLTEELIRTLRNPFLPPVELTKKKPKSELELIALKDFRLNGVITGPRKVRAMISGPGNKTFFVAVGEKLGQRDGRITSIQPDLIKVVEYEIDDRGRRTPEIFEIRITGEIVSLSKKEE